MNILNFIIAILALVIAVLAYQRSGGMKDLRQSTAEMLGKIEKRMREQEEKETEKEKAGK